MNGSKYGTNKNSHYFDIVNKVHRMSVHEIKRIKILKENSENLT